MGKHTRISAENREKLRVRNRNTRIGLAISIGGLVAGIGSLVISGNGEIDMPMDVPAEVLAGSEDYADLYGCADQPEIVIQIDDIEHENQDVVALGMTEDNLITISPDITDSIILRSTAAHEMGHACTKGLVLFDTPFEDYSFGVPMTGSDGLKAYFQDSTYATDLEEGIVEWLSEGTDNYRKSTSIGYIATSELTDSISKLRGFDRQTIADIHQSSDLLAFIALVKDKEVSEIAAIDIADVLMLYQGAFYDGHTPTLEELDVVLNYPSL